MSSRLSIALMLGALSACEGEPPKSAPGEITGSPMPQTPSPAATESDEMAHVTPNCNCPNPGKPVALGGDGGGAAVEDGGAQVASADAAAAPESARGDVIGTVTTTPTYLASMSVVWIDDAPKEPNRGMRARIDNHQMAFQPMVQVITAGGSVTFVNDDPFPHNVFSPDNEKFNMGTIAQNSTAAPRKFDHAGTYTLLCNLHPNMLGYLVVSPSSYFARTDARGHFRIKEVPAGAYKITAWAPRLPTVTQSVTVGGTTEARADFELHR
jgi:plastocyanin